ncbi:hypothetical protein GH877_30425 [Bacillus thuringiensis]|nr:hypothetical protein [Bacillus thuringiensis]
MAQVSTAGVTVTRTALVATPTGAVGTATLIELGEIHMEAITTTGKELETMQIQISKKSVRGYN